MGVAPAERLVTLPEHDPDLTLGWEVAAWLMRTLLQPNGPRAGKQFQLIDSQIRFLLWWYAVDEAGEWLYQHAVRRLSKGSGKSPFAAAVSLAELCGPVRLKDLDPQAPGGCVGMSVAMPLVQIAATAESQTENTMRMVRAFAPKGSKIVTRHRLDPGKQQYNMSPEGMLKVITSSATAAEGAEATHITADETEWWIPSNGGPDLMATLLDNLAKSGSRLMETANSWRLGIGSVAEDSFGSWVAQEEGRYQDGAARILYDARLAPPDTDMSDGESLRRALEFVYEGCWWQKTSTIIGRIWSPKARPDDSKRKYLNWPSAAVDAWVNPQEWALCTDPTVVVADGDEVVLFFDGSKSRDATALIGCRMSDGHVFTVGVWEPDPRHDTESTVDPADVDRAVRLAFERWTVVAFFGDVKEWESFVLTEWPLRYGDDLLVWAVPNGKPPAAIAWDMRSHKDEFAKAVEACHAEIVERGFTHDGDSRTARHAGNARRRPYKDMVSISKETPDSPDKVDAAVCVVGARMVRRLVLGSKAWQKRQRRVTGKGRVIVLD